MPEPQFSDILDDTEDLDDQNLLAISNLASDARVSAAYWQGRHEGLEALIGEMKEAHARVIALLASGHELTPGYLKDRLNRLEARPAGAAAEAQHGSKADG